MITMHEDNNCDICGKRSGCGKVILWITGFIVAVCIAASVYHEVTMHGAPPAVTVDSTQEEPTIDTTLENHSKIEDFPEASGDAGPSLQFLWLDRNQYIPAELGIYSKVDTIFVDFKGKTVVKIGKTGETIWVDSVGVQDAAQWKRIQNIKEYSDTL